MTLHVFNTLSGRKEPFEPSQPGKVGMYVCGVTVYDECHLGHARCYVAFDVIRRYLQHRGYDVTYVQNFTDIDDKIIRRAAELQTDALALARKFEGRYFDVFDRLGVLRADRYPRATEEIDGMVAMITQLIDGGHAYASDGDVYFSTRSFASYGRLSKRPEESILAGARVDVSEKKRDPMDFALWKKAKPGEPSWPSPWGEGRPGWHIECSVMSRRYIGDTIDIHGGGQDLIFPHHENEIAQSEAATGRPFVRYFMHNGFVTFEGEKMSKSLGNFRTLEDLYAQFPPAALRFFILSAHYRSPLTFTAHRMEEALAALQRLGEGFSHLAALLRLPPSGPSGEAAIDMQSVLNQFYGAMDDDFNTSEALAAVFQALSAVNRIHDRAIRAGSLPDDQKKNLTELSTWFADVLPNVLGLDASGTDLSEDESRKIDTLMRERDAARREKRYKDSDRIRDELAAMGYQIQDTPQGPRAVRKA